MDNVNDCTIEIEKITTDTSVKPNNKYHKRFRTMMRTSDSMDSKTLPKAMYQRRTQTNKEDNESSEETEDESVSRSNLKQQSSSNRRVKTIQKKGNTYMIREEIPFEKKYLEIDETDKMIEGLYNKALNMSQEANRKSNIFKFLYVISSFFMTIAGAVIGVLALQSYGSNTTKYVSSVLGFSVTCIQTLLSTFSIERRAVLLREVSSKLRRICRQIKEMKHTELKYKDKMKILEEYHTEVDELDLNIFDNNITVAKISNHKKLEDILSENTKQSEIQADVVPTKSKNGLIRTLTKNISPSNTEKLDNITVLSEMKTDNINVAKDNII